MTIPRLLGGGVLLLAALAACGDPAADAAPEDTPLLAFDSTRVRLVTATDTLELRVELAETPDQRAVGLMERPTLAADAGMLFTYDTLQPPEAGFWMFHTRIPLDIAYLDAEGRIVAIRSMEPCESPNPNFCPSYEPGVPYQAALEVNRGYFEQHRVGIGDRVLLPSAGGSAPQ